MTYSRLLIFLFSLAVGTGVDLQWETLNGEMLDKRDGKKYPTFKVGNALWIAENMQFETERSERHSLKDADIDAEEYYYPFDEIDEVCPCDFRIPTTEDWKNFFEFWLDDKGITIPAEDHEGVDRKGGKYFAVTVPNMALKPFEEPNPLNLRAHGHTQGGKVVGIGSMNFWIKHENSIDPKYHLHLIPEGYSIHSHDHHIIGKKKKRRKFSVRCVSDLVDLE